uniref:Uncharacterized protein n=1 Tax=Lepeophtheirus salmonis TaxID=72036 RepID=A0A0K2UFT5_LEPSM
MFDSMTGILALNVSSRLKWVFFGVELSHTKSELMSRIQEEFLEHDKGDFHQNLLPFLMLIRESFIDAKGDYIE